MAVTMLPRPRPVQNAPKTAMSARVARVVPMWVARHARATATARQAVQARAEVPRGEGSARADPVVVTARVALRNPIR